MEKKEKRKDTDIIIFAIAFAVALAALLFILFRSYTITMELNGGGDTITQSYNINSGDIALGIPTRSGYRFVGWTGSNGDTPQSNIVVGSGTIGNLTYTANWSDDLNVTCEDWVIDRYGNRILNITAIVDRFLNEGNSAKGYEAQERTIQCKVGDNINPERWGADKSYKAYSEKYVYVSSSGRERVENDGLTVYRYFYPVIDVNYRLDGESVSGETAEAVSLFDLKVDGTDIVYDVSDFCRGIPYGSEYEIIVKPMQGYAYDDRGVASGTMGDDRLNVNLDFYTE